MNPGILAWFIVFARAGALLLVFPAFSAQNFPVQVRVGLAGFIAFLVSPFLGVVPAVEPSLWALAHLLFVEVSIGLLLGFVCRLIFFALDFASGVIATEMGLMLSSTFNPLAANALPLPGTILFWLGMMLLFSLNLHHWMLAAFQQTYSFVPAGAGHMSEALSLEVIRLTAQIFTVGLQIAAPVVAVSFIITMIFSVLSRAVPQMNVFTESYAFRTLAGLGVFGLTCHLMAQHIENYFRRIPEDIVRIAQLLNLGS